MPLLLRDHFLPGTFGDQFAPLSALMAAAMMTSTLRLGSMVFDNDYRHPVVLGKEVATLDVLSGGRFEFGLGAGWMGSEYEQAGLPFDPPGTRIDRFEEALQIFKGLFADEPHNKLPLPLQQKSTTPPNSYTPATNPAQAG